MIVLERDFFMKTIHFDTICNSTQGPQDLYCLPTTNGPKWHCCLESLQLNHLHTRHEFNDTPRAFADTGRGWYNICLPSTTIDWLSIQHYAGHIYWAFNRLCSRPLCKWYSWRDSRQLCHLGPFVVVMQYRDSIMSMDSLTNLLL